jgi:hypothetical protein
VAHGKSLVSEAMDKMCALGASQNKLNWLEGGAMVIYDFGYLKRFVFTHGQMS